MLVMTHVEPLVLSWGSRTASKMGCIMLSYIATQKLNVRYGRFSKEKGYHTHTTSHTGALLNDFGV